MKWFVLAVLLCVPTLAEALPEKCQGQLSPDFAKAFAADWIAAWNSHDLARILPHYADDLEFHSPGIITVANEPSGVLRGKSKVAAYWEKALKALNPTFELIDVFTGVNSVSIHWRRPGREVVETMEFNAACQVVRGNVMLKLESGPR
ncbi:MAG TPA: nuclear transport factor 2 family protein [Rhizomicrobium sp.]|nr:nuclear transport factor 2 family protein [Rhizomicrobium sp.]